MQRCLRCFRPLAACFCESIPSIDHRTRIIILQHRRERFHPFNTARIVNQALMHCQLIVQHNTELNRTFSEMELSEKVGLLYPGEDSRVLSELTPDECPNQMVVIDGTWHHAKTLMRDIPRLRTLPRYGLAPKSPGRYRIRREPNEHALSTLEATVLALQLLEPENQSIAELLLAFERMVSDQLAHPTSNWRKNETRRRGAANVPRLLTEDSTNVVVAYGEQELAGKMNRMEQKAWRPLPVVWAAERLGSGERFFCVMESSSLKDARFVERLRLEEKDLHSAVSIDAFRERWINFIRDTDHLSVYHQSNAKLLENAGLRSHEPMILKAIEMESHRKGDSLESFSQINSGSQQNERSTRAIERLEQAIALVRKVIAISRQSANASSV